MNSSFLQRAGFAFWVLWGALGVSLGAAFFQGPLLPLRDLPDHLALISLLDHGRIPESVANEHYLIQWTPVPYWVFYGSVWLLARFMDYLQAVQWILFLALLLTPLALGRLFHVCGRDGRWALLSMPLFFNHNLMWGWISYCLAIPILAMALSAWIEHQREEGSGRALAGWSCGLFLAHAQLAAFFALIVLLRILFSRTRTALRSLIPLSAPVVLGLPWLIARALGTHGRGETVAGDALIFHDPVTRMKRLADHMTNCYSGSLDDWLWLGTLGAVVGLILWSRHREQEAFDKNPTDPMISLVISLAVLAYFLAPWEIRWPVSQWSIYSRFAIIALLFAPGLIPGHFPGDRTHRLIQTSWTLLVLLFAQHNRGVYRDFNDRNDWLLNTIDTLPSDQFIMPLVFQAGDPASHLGAADQFHAYYVVRHGGYDPYLFDNPSHPVIHRQERKPVVPPWNKPGEFKRWSKETDSAKGAAVGLVIEQFDRNRIGSLSGYQRPKKRGRWVIHQRESQR
ncbi:MAG: hypothetical protein VX405_08695 [Myxococcota bacterium]|nr:hypothetical protein [Myxococcota bacterium]